MKMMPNTSTQRFIAASLSNGRKYGAAFAFAIALFANPGDADAGLVPLVTPLTPPEPFPTENPGVILTHYAAPFSSTNSDGSVNFFGVLTSLIVRRSDASFTNGTQLMAGGLDFYYQLHADLSSGPSTIKQLNLTGFGPIPGSGPIIVDAGFDISPTVAGVISEPSNPLWGLRSGGQAPVWVSHVTGPLGDDRITFDFTDPPLTGTGAITDFSLAANDRSRWLVLRTNAIAFGPGAFAFIAGSPEATVPILGPVPEPATMGFGFAVLTVCVGGCTRRRNVRRSAD